MLEIVAAWSQGRTQPRRGARSRRRNVRHSKDELCQRHFDTTLGLLELVAVGPGSANR